MMTGTSSRRPWLVGAVWTLFAVSGMIATVVALLILLAPTMNTSGITIWKFNLPEFLAGHSIRARTTIARDGVGNVVPILSGAVGSVVVTAVTAVPSAVSSELHVAATEVPTISPSAVEDVWIQNMSVGFEKMCLGWENRSRNCHDLPLDLSAVLAPSLADVWQSLAPQLQQAEQKVVSAIMGTARRSLIAGIVLLVAFAGVVVFRPPAIPSWRKAILVAVAFGCLVVPWLVTTVIVYETQMHIARMLEKNSFVAVENGDAARFSLVALIFGVCMFVTASAILIGP